MGEIIANLLLYYSKLFDSLSAHYWDIISEYIDIMIIQHTGNISKFKSNSNYKWHWWYYNSQVTIVKQMNRLSNTSVSIFKVKDFCVYVTLP